jgi:hypothetical protein
MDPKNKRLEREKVIDTRGGLHTWGTKLGAAAESKHGPVVATAAVTLQMA